MIRKINQEENAQFVRWRLRASEIAPFMSYLLFSLRYMSVDSEYTEVAATYTSLFTVILNFDGVHNYIGDDIDSGAYTLLHEACHILLAHARRIELIKENPSDREKYLWNTAGDMELNSILEEIMRKRYENMVYPDGDPYNFERRAGAESYYRRLLVLNPPTQSRSEGGNGQSSGDEQQDDDSGSDSSKDDQQGNGSGSGEDVMDYDLRDGCGEGAGAGSNSKEEQRAKRAIQEAYGEMPEHQIKEVIKKSLESGKRAGTIPNSLKEQIENAFSNKISWKQLLRNTIIAASATTLGSDRPNYRRPNRRIRVNTTMGRIFIPARKSVKIKISVVRDTSGSMDSELLSMVNAEVDSIIRNMGPSKVTVEVIDCDAEIHRTFKITGRDLSELKVAEGRGGTNMMAGIHFSLNRPTERPDVLVVLTDGETPWDASVPYHVPVVVCIASRRDDEYLSHLMNNVPKWARAVSVTG
jgi:predicted metal-dependent peptidase